MKIQYCSDLHLENASNRDFLQQSPIKPEGEILILAGDTIHIGQSEPYQAFFDRVSRDFEEVYMIPGNHEFYGGADPTAFSVPMKIKVRDNVFLVNNMSIVHKNVNFVFTTLWSLIQLRNSMLAEQNIPDFKFIKSGGESLTVVRYNHLFRQSYKFLEGAIERKKAENVVIVTHHLPSQLCSAKEFMNDALNEAFFVELHDFIYASGVNYWIYGHSHRNRHPFKINQTTLLTNQMGFVEQGEHLSFDPTAIIQF